MKKEILDKIRQWNTIIIFRHIRPDPDAIGAQAGLKVLINDYFPDKHVYLAGEEEKSLSFLASMDEVPEKDIKDSLAIICDTANTERIDDDRYKQAGETIKIDHHPNVEPFGTIAWVDVSASSTSEMIFELYIALENKDKIINPEMARLLYAGIIGDTGRFRFPNTTDKTFSYASQLIQADFSPTEIYNRLYETSLPLMRLEGYVLTEVNITKSGVGYVYLTMDTLNKFGVTSKEASLIVNSFSSLKGLKAWVFFVEEEDLIRVRLRSKGPEIRELAAQYNGGGHPMASGASLSNWAQSEQLIQQLDQLCKEKE